MEARDEQGRTPLIIVSLNGNLQLLKVFCPIQRIYGCAFLTYVGLLRQKRCFKCCSESNQVVLIGRSFLTEAHTLTPKMTKSGQP